ncbi:MAG: ABC transporter permease [Chloroflexi bacterium]|nr:ABC transporter permease [Chloroflexota bacterium]
MKNVLAFFTRDIKQTLFFRSFLVEELVRPIAWFMLYTITITHNFRTINFNGQAMDYFSFLIPGIMVLLAFQRFSSTVVKASNERRHGMFKMIMVSNVRAHEYILGRILFASTVVTLQGVLIYIVNNLFNFYRIDFRGFYTDYLVLVLMVFLAVVFWVTVGTIMGLWLDSAEQSSAVNVIFYLPVMFSSSIFYDLDRAPYMLRIIGMLNPLSYQTQVVRKLFLFGDLDMLAMSIVIFSSIGSLALAILKVGNSELVP